MLIFPARHDTIRHVNQGISEEKVRAKGGESMIETATLRQIVMVLFGLSIVWVIVMIIRNDTATLARALIVAAVLGLAFFYLGQTKIDKVSFKAVKEDLFPPKEEFFTWNRTDSQAGGHYQTRFIFTEPGPRLILDMESGGKHLTIKDVEPLNRVLDKIGLPPVKTGTRELSAITGSLIDANTYRWDDYEPGVLSIERSICRNLATTESYHCIVSITITYR